MPEQEPNPTKRAKQNKRSKEIMSAFSVEGPETETNDDFVSAKSAPWKPAAA